jgi:tetratricopeptide (TPR) repeat protein
VSAAGALPVVALAAPPAGVARSLQDAEAAYARGDYPAALERYREVLAAGWASASLYYDLGCAAQRAGEPGWAVGYFEEARRRAPRDPDVRHNLKVTRALLRDQAGREASSGMLDRAAGGLDAIAPWDALGAFAAALWGAALALLGSWFLPGRPRSWARRARPWLALLLLATGALLLVKVYQVRSAPSGVVVEREIGVRAGPSPTETVQFALHAGALVHVGRAAGEWTEIRLAPEMRGWVPRAAVLELTAPRWSP